jgi:hypothetical protein
VGRRAEVSGFTGNVVVSLFTGPQGKFVLPGIPGGGGPVSFYVQILIQDPNQPLGWALTNAIKPQLLP